MPAHGRGVNLRSRRESQADEQGWRHRKTKRGPLPNDP